MQLFLPLSKFDIMTSIKILIAQDTYQAKLLLDYYQTQYWNKAWYFTQIHLWDSVTDYLQGKDLTINITTPSST